MSHGSSRFLIMHANGPFPKHCGTIEHVTSVGYSDSLIPEDPFLMSALVQASWDVEKLQHRPHAARAKRASTSGLPSPV